MARAPKPGGLLGFDIPNRDVVVKELPASHVIDKGGDLIINCLSFDVLMGRFHNRRIITRDGVRKDEPPSVRLYNATEIRDLVSRAALKVYKGSESNGQPVPVSSQRMVVIARKPRPLTRREMP